MIRGALPAIVMLALVSGCGTTSGAPKRIDWDLSRGHARQDVGFRPDSQPDRLLEPVASLRIRLPEGRVFTPLAPVKHVIVNLDGEQVQVIEVDGQDMSTEGAYRLAKRYAQQFDLDTRGLDQWLRQRLAGRRQGREDLLDRAQIGTLTGRIGKDGPVPGIEIDYTADDAKPSYVSVQFDWTKLDPG